MKIVVWKNDKESNERAITRFTKKVQACKKILDIKNSRYRVKPKTKSKVRMAAIKREEYRAKREKSRFY